MKRFYELHPAKKDLFKLFHEMLAQLLFAFPGNKNILKVSNKITRKMCEIRSKLIVKTHF